jgi:hypothetical protein
VWRRKKEEQLAPPHNKNKNKIPKKLTGTSHNASCSKYQK